MTVNKIAASIAAGRCYHCHLTVWDNGVHRYTRQDGQYTTECSWSPTKTHSTAR